MEEMKTAANEEEVKTEAPKTDKKKAKKPLVFTTRVIRMFVTEVILVAVIVAVPVHATTVTFPLLSTVATLSLSDFQVTV